ncbi:pickpocket protein 28-like [Cochliomyia hominivorax]
MHKKGIMVNVPQRKENILPVRHQNQRSISIISETLSEVPSEIIIKSRIKYGSRWSFCMGLLAEYSKKSSISGINYIFEEHRPFYEKFFWLLVLLLSFYLAIFLMIDTYTKWLSSPIILVFSETLIPIHKIPFPTITICPEIKMDKTTFDFSNVSRQIWSEIEKYKKFNNFANITKEDLERFSATLQICDTEVSKRFAPHLSKDKPVDVVNLLREMALTSSITLSYCKWNGRFYFCEKIFKHILTDEGLCYQFNGLKDSDIYRDINYISYTDNIKTDLNNYYDQELPKFNKISGNWSLDKGYIGQGFNAYPQRLVLSSARNGLFVFMMGFQYNFDYTCRSFKQGYKVFLNSPESVALTSGNYILVPHDHEISVTILPQYIISTDNLRDFSPEKRQCYFNDERYLRFFKSYSQSNCQIECLTNFTISKCGCVKFWMPKPSKLKICGLADIECYNHAADEMSLIIANQTKQKLIQPNMKILCDCMPSCNSLDYNFEIMRSSYELKKTLRAQRQSGEFMDARASRFSAFYKETQFTAIKRTIIYDVTTLISNCGGIFGLFMGISGFSIVELIYFFSIRLFYNLRKRHYINKKLMELDLEP